MPRMASAATHPESRLLFACARLSPDLAQVRECAAGLSDWEKVADAAEYHGLTPLLLRNLKEADASVPEATLRDLERRNAAAVRQNLFLTAEMLRVVDALQHGRVQVIPLKGAVLATQVYGDLGLRPFTDIDLLVKPEQLEEAEAVVKQLGYAAEFALPSAHRERWLKHQCELTFRRGDLCRVELHWDIAHPHFTLRTGVEGFWARTKTVRLGDAALPSLCDNDLLFMLIVHGTRHAWSRLMWAVDVAEFLRSSPQIDWAGFVENAKERGAERMMASALLLVEETFGVKIANHAVQHLYQDRSAARLAKRAFERWSESLESAELPDLEPSPLWRRRWIMKTRENRAQRWSYAGRVLTMEAEEEFGTARLPKAMAPFYKLVRFWNVIRKARPKSPPRRAASAQGKS